MLVAGSATEKAEAEARAAEDGVSSSFRKKGAHNNHPFFSYYGLLVSCAVIAASIFQLRRRTARRHFGAPVLSIAAGSPAEHDAGHGAHGRLPHCYRVQCR